jgi:hypothetical protein
MSAVGSISYRLTVRLADFPAVVWGLTHQLAEILREEAEGEPEFVARRLRGIAASFEAGAGAACQPETDERKRGQGDACSAALGQGARF